MNALPRALVLAGGGARAAYEVGVLAAIAERASGLEFPIVTGVSAGAINAVYLAAHPGPLATAVGALRAQWSRLVVERVYRIRAGRLARGLLAGTAHPALGRGGAGAAVHGLVDMSPLREFLGANIDFTQLAANIAARRLRAAAMSTTSYATGQSVSFVHGPPDVPTWRRALRYAVATPLTLDHVMASAALPILFPAVRIGDAFYGDGSVRQTAPLAPAIHLGARAIVAVNPRNRPRPPHPPPPGPRPSAAPPYPR